MLRPSVQSPSPSLLLVLSVGLSGACRGPGAGDSAVQAPRWERIEAAPQAARYAALHGEQVVAVYQAQAHPYKPYVEQLRTPAGVQILRDSPEDHVHHHALMFALRADGTNFWEELTDPGTEATTSTRIDGDTLESALVWRDHGGGALLDEQRQIRLDLDPAATQLTWRSTLTPAAGRDTVTLSGEHYHGLGMRFVTSMDEVAAFVHPVGTTSEAVRGTERLTSGDWAACTGTVEGHGVTVVMMSHPDQVQATLWFTMTAPFAYLAATCNGWRESVRMRYGESLELVYGVALLDGRASCERIQAQYDRWVAATSPPRSTATR